MDKPEIKKPGAQAAIPINKPLMPKGQEGLLRTVVQKLRADFEGFKHETVKSAQAVATRAVVIGEQVMRVFTILGDIEGQVEALKTVLIRKDVCSADEFEAAWDEIKGLRVKAAGEPITDGDFVRVDFKIVSDGKVLSEETNYPMRIGAGHLLIEGALIGKLVGGEPFSVDHTYDKGHQNPDLAGKTVTFEVVLGRVKTSIKKEQP